MQVKCPNFPNFKYIPGRRKLRAVAAAERGVYDIHK